MARRFLSIVLCLVLTLPMSGCLDMVLRESGVLGLFMVLISGGGGYSYKSVDKVESDVDVDIVADVGGLSGTYEVTLSDPGGGDFGTFTGTGTVKRGRFVTLKAKDTPELLATVEALAEKALGEQVTITRAKAKVKTWQAPGGVEAGFKAKVKFKGTVDSGPNAGGKIKKGKITGLDIFPQGG